MANHHYEKRMKEHRQREAKLRAAQRESARHVRMFEVDGMLSDYERAHKEAHGRVCHLIYRGGWVYMAECATFRVRIKVLGALAAELRDAAAHGIDPQDAIALD